MQLFILFWITVSIFFSSGCTYSTIKIRDNNQLIILNDKTTVEIKTPAAETKKINMSSILIDQYIIAADKDNCIVYEDIRTAVGYRFNHAYRRSIDLIFNAHSVATGKRYGNLTFYRVTLRDKTVLHLLALTASKKSLKLVYGFDDKAVAALQQSLDQNNTVVKYELSTTTERRDHCIKSNWQPKLLILDNLVGKEGGKIKSGGF